MKTLLSILIVSFTFTLFGQNCDCKKFHTGTFKIEYSGYTLLIKRNSKYQIEKDLSSGEKIKLKITWENDCTYRLTFIKGNRKYKKSEMGSSPVNQIDLIVTIIDCGDDYYNQVSRLEGAGGIDHKSRVTKIK